MRIDIESEIANARKMINNAQEDCNYGMAKQWQTILVYLIELKNRQETGKTDDRRNK